MLQGISIARACSCLLIAAFHVAEFLNANGGRVHFPFKHTPGIHVFMVISGFMCMLMARPDDTFWRFISRRLARLLPLYWLCTSVAIALVTWKPWLLSGADLSWSSVASSYLLLPHFDQAGHVQPILFVGWMVNYIVMLNLIFAAALRWGPLLRPLIVAGVISTLMGLSFMLPPGAWRTFLQSPFQLEFAAGVLIGAVVNDAWVARWFAKWPAWPLIAGGVICLTAASLSDLTGAARVGVCGAFASVAVFGLVCQDMYRTPTKGGVLAWLGQISYSIYLIHPLVIPIVGVVIVSANGAALPQSIAMYVIAFAVTIAAAALSYAFIERPSNAWLRRKLGVTPKAQPARAEKI